MSQCKQIWQSDHVPLSQASHRSDITLPFSVKNLFAFIIDKNLL